MSIFTGRHFLVRKLKQHGGAVKLALLRLPRIHQRARTAQLATPPPSLRALETHGFVPLALGGPWLSTRFRDASA